MNCVRSLMEVGVNLTEGTVLLPQSMRVRILPGAPMNATVAQIIPGEANHGPAGRLRTGYASSGSRKTHRMDRMREVSGPKSERLLVAASALYKRFGHPVFEFRK